MKRTLTFLLSTMMLTAVLSSCSSEDTSTPSTTSNSSSSTASDSGSTTTTTTGSEKEADSILTMGGSTSVEEIIAAMMQVYMEENDGFSITYSGTGSSTGVSDALASKIDIGLASRGLKSSEEDEGAVAHIFAYDGIALIVNNDNPISNLSSDELASIFKKEITNWVELGGNEGQIVIVGRDAASGTRGAFEEILGITDETLYDSELEATGSVISTVAGNPNAIGYVSLSAVESQVATIAVDGVEASEETIKDESYPIQRPFLFVTNDAVSDPETDAFIAWATSDAVADLVTSKGAVSPN